MKIKRVTFRDAMAIGGPLSGKTANETDFDIDLSAGIVTLVHKPKDGSEPRSAYLVPFNGCQAAEVSIEELTAPARKGK